MNQLFNRIGIGCGQFKDYEDVRAYASQLIIPRQRWTSILLLIWCLLFLIGLVSPSTIYPHDNEATVTHYQNLLLLMVVIFAWMLESRRQAAITRALVNEIERIKTMSKGS